MTGRPREGRAAMKLKVLSLDLVAPGARREGAKAPDLTNLSSYELTSELFWGEVAFEVGGADFGGHYYLLDLLIGWTHALRGLAGRTRTVFEAAEGLGDFAFKRRDDRVEVSRDGGPRASVGLGELQTCVESVLADVLQMLVKEHPALRKNAGLGSLLRGLALPMP